MILSVVVPTLNEERAIAATLRVLRAGAPAAEVICVDGGSTDATCTLAAPLSDRLIVAPRGRAKQMNAGAAAAHGNVLAFVHADTLAPPDFARQIETALGDHAIVGGRFDVVLDHPALRYRLLGWAISTRSRLMRSATGDQAIFVRRTTFERLGAFPEIELCEDVEFFRRLRRVGRIACLRATVHTSSRRWREQGFIMTIFRMWTIKACFMLGVSPARLKRSYVDAR